MKNKILLIITILLLTSACSSNYLKKINYKTLNQKIKNEETFVLYLTDLKDEGITLRNTLLKTAKENDLKVYYLNTTKLTDENLNNLKNSFYFEETNTIIFVNKGMENTILSRITDTYISQKDLEKELKIQGYIK